MGWCSGTDVFDKVCDYVINLSLADEAVKFDVLLNLAGALEDNDWDCQQDSNYYDDPIVQKVMRTMHPDWFEDEVTT